MLVTSVLDVCAPRVLYNTPRTRSVTIKHSWDSQLDKNLDASGILRFIVSVPRLARLARLATLDRHFPYGCSCAGSQSTKIGLILATNRPSDLDDAICDRMDEMMEFGLPGAHERERIFRAHLLKYMRPPSAGYFSKEATAVEMEGIDEAVLREVAETRTYSARKKLTGKSNFRVIRWLNKVLTVDSTVSSVGALLTVLLGGCGGAGDRGLLGAPAGEAGGERAGDGVRQQGGGTHPRPAAGGAPDQARGARRAREAGQGRRFVERRDCYSKGQQCRGGASLRGSVEGAIECGIDV
eukprot:1194338-Prorocentrum_minimum.AAC.5